MKFRAVSTLRRFEMVADFCKYQDWGTVSPFQGNTMSQRPTSDNPKVAGTEGNDRPTSDNAKSTQARSSILEYDAGTSSHVDAVAPPAYIP